MSSLKVILTFTLICISKAITASPATTQNESGSLKINTDLTAAAVGSIGLNIENNLNIDGNNKLNATPIHHVASNANTNANKTSDNSATNITMLENHICTREETYVEQLKTPSMQPVRIRSSNWCMEFPPRCSNYKTEMREVMKVQNVTKRRTIRFCCDGYAGNISMNDTVCKPVCRGGCGRGYCQKPDECSCDAGYIGKHCTQRCDHDHWGDACKNRCRCENNAVCDNKSGLCHCTTGWAGEFCELPCPVGTFGVMCRKKCECYSKTNINNQCHKQTGECPSTAGIQKTADTKQQQAADNVTHAMIQTLNSTIANITHNLDRIAKNIVHIATTPSPATDAVTYLLPDLLDITTAHPVPEVIVIKQHAGESQHTPKIIVHQPGTGLLENLHAAANSPEVIHVITNWQQHPNGSTVAAVPTLDLASIGGVVAAAPPHNSNAAAAEHHDSNLLSTLLIILLMIMIAIAFGFLYVYRRYHLQRQRVEAALAERSTTLGNRQQPPEVITSTMGNVGMGGGGVGGTGVGESLGKSFLKPLPDLPAFTQMVCNKIEGPVYYDTPSSNASVKTIPSYSYARKESLYSVVSPKSRKGSLDSHLYDEIRYPLTHQQQQHHRQHQHQHQHHHQQQLPNLQIPPQNIHYLQVPHQQSHSNKINHM